MVDVMKSVLRIFSLILMVIVLMTSCKSTKNITKDLNGPNPERARFEAVVANHYKYEALQSKVKLSMGKSSLNGRMCIESGKRFCLLANAPLLGFEVARIEATRDSVVLVDKFDKIYTVITLGELTQMDALAGHEMEALECLMLGRIFIPGKGMATSKDYDQLSWTTPKSANGETPLTMGLYKGKNYELTYTINAQGQLMQTSLTTQDGKKANWQYATYQVVDKKNVATDESIIATNADKKELRAGITLTNPTLGESTWRDFEPTGSYRRVTMEELGDILKKLAN